MRNTFVLAALVLTPFATGGAQSPANPKLTPGAESAFVRYAESFLLDKLAGRIAFAPRDTATQPWKFTFPTVGSPERWEQLRAQLTVSMRVRDPSPRDSTYSYFRIYAPRFRGDTMLFFVYLGFMQHCAMGSFEKTWWDNAQIYQVSSVHSGEVWLPPTVKQGETYSPLCHWNEP